MTKTNILGFIVSGVQRYFADDSEGDYTNCLVCTLHREGDESSYLKFIFHFSKEESSNPFFSIGDKYDVDYTVRVNGVNITNLHLLKELLIEHLVSLSY